MCSSDLRAPRQPAARAELARALRTLGFAEPEPGPGGDVAVVGGSRAVAGPVFLPNVRRLDSVLRDGSRLPEQLGPPLAVAVTRVLHDVAGPVLADDAIPVRRGELGTCFDDRAAS